MFTTENVAEITGGAHYGATKEITGLSTDTRTIQQGDLFVAVRGERFDGNDFAQTAMEKGAAAILTDDAEREFPDGMTKIVVRDARIGQLMLAREHRRNTGVKVCGVTGSVGKTSTKDMIYAVLSSKYGTLKTEGNLNNDIGLPKTLFRLDKEQTAVIEMGMSDLGEISVLSMAAEPDCAVITNIGYCHIENLKTRQNILKAKLEILDHAKADAPLIVCGDDEFLRGITPEKAGDRQVVKYGFGGNCDIRAEELVHLENGERFVVCAEGGRYEAEIPVNGAHHVLNALCAFAVGREFGMTAEEIVPAFMNYEASGMRQRIEKRGNKTVILDCYNASPTSMKSSLSVLGGMEVTGRKIAVLGDMLELGDVSAQLHALIAEYVKENAECAFLYGQEMAFCRDALIKGGFEVYHSEDKEQLTKMLLEYIKDGDAVLFKGSRGMRMEEIAENITE